MSFANITYTVSTIAIFQFNKVFASWHNSESKKFINRLNRHLWFEYPKHILFFWIAWFDHAMIGRRLVIPQNMSLTWVFWTSYYFLSIWTNICDDERLPILLEQRLSNTCFILLSNLQDAFICAIAVIATNVSEAGVQSGCTLFAYFRTLR